MENSALFFMHESCASSFLLFSWSENLSMWSYSFDWIYKELIEANCDSVTDKNHFECYANLKQIFGKRIKQKSVKVFFWNEGR